MDMGIAGRTALVCAASKGLGRGCAEALAAEGVNLVITARTAETLEATAASIRAQYGVNVQAVACDITTPEGHAAALAACPTLDILVNNAGGPPPGDFRSFTHEMWIKALEGNMLTPIELMKATDHRRHDRARLRAHREHHELLGEGAHRRAGPVQRRAFRAHRLRRGRGAQGGRDRRHDQQSAAGHLRHGPHRRDAGGAGEGEGAEPAARRSAQAPRRKPAGRTLRHAGRVRPRVRIPVQRACGLYHRAEPADSTAAPMPPIDSSEFAGRGSLYFTRPTLFSYIAKRSDLDAMAAELFEVVSSGKVKTNVRQRHPLSDAARAHEDLEARRTTGSTILLP